MSKNFDELVEIIRRLRDPIDGCPWDLKQTHDTLKKYLIEEAYETIDAIDNNGDLADELGDVLLQVLLHSQIAKDANTFNIDDVMNILKEKMIVRHPHIFGDVKVKDANEVVKNWNLIKEGKKKTELTQSLPALIKLKKLGSKVHHKDVDFGEDKIGKICSILYQANCEGEDLEVGISKRISDIYNQLNSNS